MNDQLEMIPGTNRSAEHSQYFTPPKLAQRVVQWALPGADDDSWHRSDVRKRPMRVLEPSAGNGALVRPLVAAGAIVAACEIDGRYLGELFDAVRGSKSPHVSCPTDFLAHATPEKWGPFDLVVCNPPYHDDGEAKFITHALKFAPRVVGIFRADVFYTVSRGEALWKHVRPTRVAFCSRRPWKGAETDYCVLELVKREEAYTHGFAPAVSMEWWGDAW